MLIARLFWCALLSVSVVPNESAKILFYNAARIAHSHIAFMGKIADVLQESGHNVTFYQQQVYKSVKTVGVQKAKAVVREADVDMGNQPNHNVWHPDKGIVANLEMFKAYANAISQACEFQLRDNEYLENLKAEKFDLAILEYFDVCGLAIIEKAGITKWVATSALMEEPEMLKILGHPLNLAFVPGMGSDFGSKLSYSQRVKALIAHPIKWAIYQVAFGNVYYVIEKALGKRFDYEEALAKSSYVLVNIDEHLAFQMPLSRKIVHIGGLGQDGAPKALPKDIKSVLDNAKKGVILISFGSIAQSASMPDEKKEIILKTAEHFKEYNFIWKYEVDDNIGSNLTNLHKRKWVPQPDLLGHPKLLAFVTHGGLNSVGETAHRGKPFVCVPLFADQNNNCFAGEEKGLGVIVMKDDFSTERLVKGLDQVLHNPKFKARAEHFAKMMSSKPFQPRDRIIGFVNHALEFDVHTTLDLPSRHLTFVEYYFIDIIVPMVLSVLLILFLVYKLFKFAYQSVCGLRKIKAE